MASVGECYLIYYFALNVLRMFICTQTGLKEHSKGCNPLNSKCWSSVSDPRSVYHAPPMHSRSVLFMLLAVALNLISVFFFSFFLGGSLR